MRLPNTCAKIGIGFLIATTVVSFAVSQNVSHVSKEDLQAYHWRLLGPFRGGRVLAVTGVPAHLNRFYFGAVDGGVWETNDAGRTWKPIFDREPVGSIGAIAVAPSDPDVLYVGTGEADMRSDIAIGNGVYKSDDGGRTWQHLGLSDTEAIGKILVDPTDPNTLYVAALGHPYGANDERGVYKSTDGGSTWTHVLNKGPNVGAIDLAFDPSNSQTVYAAMWQTRRPPWNVYPPSNGPGSGLYKSTDGGQSWQKISSNGFPANPGRIGIAIAPSEPNLVYAVVDAPQGGLYRSKDGGKTWSLASSDQRIWGRGWYFCGVTVNPTDPNDVYVCNTALYESKDGGKLFEPIKGAPGGDDYHTLWIDPQNATHRILGVDQGCVVSVDGGKTWSSWYNEPIAQIYQVAADNRFPYWVYGAQQDSGAVSLPSNTWSIDGINMTDFREITVGGESDMIAPDPLDPNLVYGGTVDKLNRHLGLTVGVSPTASYPGIYRNTWTLPLVFSQADPHRLYFANQCVFETSNGGSSWKKISGDLSKPNPKSPSNLEAVDLADTVISGPQRGVVYALAPSPLNKNVLWAGTDDGNLWMTLTNGSKWQKVHSFPDWDKVSGIEASYVNPSIAYVSVDAHRLDNFTPMIYKVVVTKSGKATLSLITNGIPMGSFVNRVRQDPKVPSTLYAATENGGYISFDEGLNWQPLQFNLPTTSVRDVIVKNHDLVIATHGRGFYVLTDLDAIRGIASAAHKKGAVLFTPEPAYEVHAAGFTGSPMPKSEPRGENPPEGAIFDYEVNTPVSGVSLRVIKDGKVVFQTVSAAKPSPGRSFAVDIAPGWFPAPIRLGTSVGMHRFVWNLHDSNGLWVPPGRYEVMLGTANGYSTRYLEVRLDPRAKITPTQAATNWKLAIAINADSAKLNLLMQSAGLLIHQATQVLQTHYGGITAAGGAQSSTERACRVFLARLVTLSDIPLSVDPRNSVGTPLTNADSFRALSGRFGTLSSMVENSDGPLSANVMTGLKQSEQGLKVALAKWKALTNRALPKLNRQLRKSGISPLRQTMGKAKKA